MIGKVFGFLRYVLLLRLYGTDSAVDIIIFLISLVWFWSNTVVSSLFSIRLVPLLSTSQSELERGVALLKIFSGINAISILVALVILISPQSIVNAFSGSDDAVFLAEATAGLWLLIPLLILVPLTEVVTLYNQWRGSFKVVASNLVVWNFTQLIGLLYLSATHDPAHLDTFIFSFLVFLILGYLATSVIQLYFSRIASVEFSSMFFSFSVTNFLGLVRGNFKLVLGVLFLQLGIYIDNFFLLSLEAGSLSTYTGLARLCDIFQSLVGAALGAVVLNRVSLPEVIEIGWWYKIWTLWALSGVVFVIFCYFFGAEFVALIFGGEFQVMLEDGSSRVTLLVLSFSAWLFVGVLLLTKIFIARDKGNGLIIASVLGVCIKVFLTASWYAELGLMGVASASVISIASVFCCLVLLLGVQRGGGWRSV
ncbi:hypothetical protein N9X48_07290 [Luminiphilus sp.]|nr:hypothetical protein [Luminiphilus sp.]